MTTMPGDAPRDEKCCNDGWTRKDTATAWNIVGLILCYVVIAGMFGGYYGAACLAEDPLASCRGSGIQGIFWPFTTPYNIGHWAVQWIVG